MVLGLDSVFPAAMVSSFLKELTSVSMNQPSISSHVEAGTLACFYYHLGKAGIVRWG